MFILKSAYTLNCVYSGYFFVGGREYRGLSSTNLCISVRLKILHQLVLLSQSKEIVKMLTS